MWQRDSPFATSIKNEGANGALITKSRSAYLTRTAESSWNPKAPAGRVLAQNEFRTQRRPLNVAFVLRRTV